MITWFCGFAPTDNLHHIHKSNLSNKMIESSSSSSAVSIVQYYAIINYVTLTYLTETRFIIKNVG